MEDEKPNEVTVGDRTFRIGWGCNTACRMEGIEPGKSYADILHEVATKPTARQVRDVIRAAIIEPAEPTIEDAGLVVDAMGGYLLLSRMIATQMGLPAGSQSAATRQD